MNRSFIVFAGVVSIALALVLSTQISTSAKINAPANQKQPHRLAVQDDVNDPAVMNLALHNVFILGLALRNVCGDTPEISVALPMSRTDIATIPSLTAIR